MIPDRKSYEGDLMKSFELLKASMVDLLDRYEAAVEFLSFEGDFDGMSDKEIERQISLKVAQKRQEKKERMEYAEERPDFDREKYSGKGGLQHE